MRIVYVSDNRCRANYGCRATSTALSQLIGEEHTIVGRISGAYTHLSPGNLVVNHKWSANHYKRLGKLKKWDYLSKIFFLWNRFKGRMRGKYFAFGPYDFVSYNLEKSLNYLIKCFPANKHIQEYDLRQYDFDAIVVNGEGSFIFATPFWREAMVLTIIMYWAIKMGKKVYFLNAMFSDDPNSAHNELAIKTVSDVLKKCEVVQVREEWSLEYAKRYLKLSNVKLMPDALFSWYDLVNDSFNITDGKYIMPFSRENDSFYKDYSFLSPYILIAASSSSKIGSNLQDAINSYCDLVKGVKRQFPQYACFLIETCPGDSFLNNVSRKTNTPLIPVETPIVSAAKICAGARLFITGRYHPAIMASLGGTPCVFMDSNSHKTKSLQKLLQYNNPHEYSCIPSKKEIERILIEAKGLLDDQNIRSKIRDRSKELSKEVKKISTLLV